MQFGEDSSYYPLIYFNDFWLLKDKLVPVNESLTSATIHFDLGHISFMWCVSAADVCAHRARMPWSAIIIFIDLGEVGLNQVVQRGCFSDFVPVLVQDAVLA
jgi:hypothetical protein